MEKRTLQGVSTKLAKKAKIVKNLYPTGDRFIVNFNYGATVKRYSELNSLEKCIDDKYITLAELNKIYNPQIPILLIEAWLYVLNDYFNIGNEDKMLKKEQIMEIADLFYQKAFYLNIPEIRLFFMKCRLGEFGNIYGTFSGIVLMSWLNIFLSKRMTVIQKVSNSKDLTNTMRIDNRGSAILKIYKEGNQNSKETL